MKTRSGARIMAAAAAAGMGLLSMSPSVGATTASVTAGDLEKLDYKCERAGIAGWICRKPGDRWLCPNLQSPCTDIPRIG